MENEGMFLYTYLTPPSSCLSESLAKRKPDEHEWWRSHTERLQDVHSCSPAKSYEEVTEISLIEERRPLIVEILRT